jgi:hypothetical protein
MAPETRRDHPAPHPLAEDERLFATVCVSSPRRRSGRWSGDGRAAMMSTALVRQLFDLGVMGLESRRRLAAPAVVSSTR